MHGTEIVIWLITRRCPLLSVSDVRGEGGRLEGGQGAEDGGGQGGQAVAEAIQAQSEAGGALGGDLEGQPRHLRLVRRFAQGVLRGGTPSPMPLSLLPSDSPSPMGKAPGAHRQIDTSVYKV